MFVEINAIDLESSPSVERKMIINTDHIETIYKSTANKYSLHLNSHTMFITEASYNYLRAELGVLPGV